MGCMMEVSGLVVFLGGVGADVNELNDAVD